MSLISPDSLPEDENDGALRPLSLKDFTGQKEICENLKIFIQAAQGRKEALDHVLLSGPPGLGKTTLAQIIAKEMNVGFKATSAPILTKAGDLAALLTNLQPQDVLFIDEIHRLPAPVEEMLYTAMEDFKIDILIGEGPAARSIRLDVQPFTLIGATTRSGLLTQPLRERFGIPFLLSFYTEPELVKILLRAARLLNAPVTQDGAQEMARRSRGTPRVAGRLLRRVRDLASVLAPSKEVGSSIASLCLGRLGVNERGLDLQDQRYLRLLAEYYQGGPAGIETLAAALSEKKDTLEEVVEPYLMQQGFIQRTPRGRMLTNRGWEAVGLNPQKTVLVF